jgi:hypothetical protein
MGFCRGRAASSHRLHCIPSIIPVAVDLHSNIYSALSSLATNAAMWIVGLCWFWAALVKSREHEPIEVNVLQALWENDSSSTSYLFRVWSHPLPCAGGVSLAAAAGSHP